METQRIPRKVGNNSPISTGERQR